MKHLKRHILIWLFLFYGLSANASHVLGGEIFYKHIKDNQYKVTINIYRDCNGCKINGTGGGNSAENCSEIDFLYVKGTDYTTSKETKFSLTREKVSDISPFCRSKISTCRNNSNSIYGIELQQFSAIVDLDNSQIKGYCKYYIYVAFAERNNNITTGQAKQNFCIDAFIQTCLDSKNNSADFISQPTFIVNSNTSQYQSAYAIDMDKDSLVYTLTPALYAINKEVNYITGFNFSYPLSAYCIGSSPCTADKTKETGYYINKYNGSIVYIPTKASEIGVVALKVEEYRKIAGQWELIGYIKRDIQVYVKTSDGNNSPKFLNNDYYEICEEETLVIKVETTDERNPISLEFDSVNYTLNTTITGSSFTQYTKNTAPYNYGIFKWTPQIGASSNGLYTISLTAHDNFCPLNAVSNQIISIKVKPKEDLKIITTDLGCGNFEIQSSSINNQSKLLLKLYNSNDVNTLLFSSSKTMDTVSYLPYGEYILQAILTSFNGCETIVNHFIHNLAPRTSAFIKGDSNVCKGIDYTFSINNLSSTKFNILWAFDSQKIGNGYSISNKFLSDGDLTAILNLKKGKWNCIDTLKKEIKVIVIPEILNSDKNEICHKSGDYDLKNIAILPPNGIWSSANTLFNNGLINTNAGLSYYDDTVILNYEITKSGCVYSKNIDFIILAVPEFELSTLTICEISSPFRFEHLIKKPYKISDYNFNWNLPLFPDKIRDVGGYKVFYPSEIGYGFLDYQGEVIAKNGCKNLDTAIIEITPVVKIKFKNEINLCQGSGMIDITELSGVTPDNGNWSFIDFGLISNRKFANTDTCGVYEATYVYDNYGCYDTKKINITIACKPEMQIIGLKNKMCDSELKLPLSLYATPTGGIWEGKFVSSGLFFPPPVTQTTPFEIKYSINKGLCKFTEKRTVEVNPSPIINIAPDKFNFCMPEPINISGSVSNTNKLNFEYNNETIEENISHSKDYSSLNLFKSFYSKTSVNKSLKFTATNNEGCITRKDYSIRVFDQPKISPLRDTFVCENSGYEIAPAISYNGNEPLTHSWTENSGEIDNSRNFNSNKLLVGNHSLNFKTGNEYCSDSKLINIEIKPKPMVDFIIMPTNTTTIVQPSFWFMNQSAYNKSSLWNFGTNRSDNFSNERNAIYSYQDTGTFQVSLTETDIFGCSNTLSRTVVVKPDLLIFIPNAFTPNNKDEEKNNVFSISLKNYNTYSMEIFDRWGHKVFYSEDPTESWDGKSGDAICTPDIYFYSIKINSITNHLYHYRGSITLIK